MVYQDDGQDRSLRAILLSYGLHVLTVGLNKVHPSTAGGQRPQRRGRLDRNKVPLLRRQSLSFLTLY